MGEKQMKTYSSDIILERKKRSGKQTPTKPLDIHKQNIKALKYIAYARLRMYEI